MNPLQSRFCIVSLLLLGCSSSSFGGDYIDPTGFSFTYPEGWVPVSRDRLKDVNEVIPKETKKWLDKNKLDLSKVAVTLVRNAREDFLENLNVVVEYQELPLDDKTVKTLTDMILKQYQAMGAKVEEFESKVQKVGSRDALVLDYKSRLPGTISTIRQRQIYFPGGGKTFIVTCTTKPDTFEKYLPTFEKILESFKIPTPTTKPGELPIKNVELPSILKGFDGDRILRTGVMGAIIGAVVGGLVWIFKKTTSA